jgi:dihydroorotate dehydrogenase electron transfer subunit
VPGQVLALRPTFSPIEPLLRTPVHIADADAQFGTLTLILDADHGWGRVRVGDTLDVLGPVGRGWNVPADVRNILLIGTDDAAGALVFLANAALRRSLSVAMLLGASPDHPAFPTALVPPAVEYQWARSDDPAQAALDLLDPDLLRWADALYTTLPLPAYERLAARIRTTRLRWVDGFAQGLLLPPMACYTGICDACRVPAFRRTWRACVDGPQCEVRDVAR